MYDLFSVGCVGGRERATSEVPVSEAEQTAEAGPRSVRTLGPVAMNVTARVDYAVRAVVELAGSSRDSPRRLHDIAAAQGIPVPFLTGILTQLRSSGVVGSQRGAGYWLARPAEELDLGRVIRAVDGTPVQVRGQAPEDVEYVGSAVALQQVWIALRGVLEQVTIADVAAGELPLDMRVLARGAQPS